ncbi:MAG: glutamyl-tRNA reductase [Planctomycetota bacterium]|nr:glutamyl-tRNA reductase [Planctomycetota bacterium]
MNLQVLSCNHHTADLSLREKLAFSTEGDLHQAYRQLKSAFPSTEVVVLSTCNRVELYTAQIDEEMGPSRDEIAKFFSEFHDVPVDLFMNEMWQRHGVEAVRHLFQVACSLDSMVLGEPQIVNQLKEAYRVAQENAACGPLTNPLFQQAIRVSARVRSETELAEGRVSIASVAVGEFGRNIFDRFDDKLIVVIGAGEMAEETLRYLQAEGAKTIVAVNRGFERGQKLAQSFAGSAKPWEELDRWISEADVVVSTTGADQPIMTTSRMKALRKSSGRKPLLILDLGAPRDFEPAIAEIDEDVFLYDIDDLEATCERNKAARSGEVTKALKIIDEETNRFMHDVSHRATGPVIKQLREQWHRMQTEEVERVLQKLSHLEQKDKDYIAKSYEQMVNKMLHPPLEALREEAKSGTPHGLLDALRRLFGIGDR